MFAYASEPMVIDWSIFNVHVQFILYLQAQATYHFISLFLLQLFLTAYMILLFLHKISGNEYKLKQ